MSSSANWSQIFRNSKELIRSGFLTTWNEQPLVVRTECNDLKWKFVLALVHAHTATILKMQPAQWGWGAGAGRAGLLALTVNRAVIFKHSKFSCKFFTGQFMAIICNAHHFPARAKRVLSADLFRLFSKTSGCTFANACERWSVPCFSSTTTMDPEAMRPFESPQKAMLFVTIVCLLWVELVWICLDCHPLKVQPVQP